MPFYVILAAVAVVAAVPLLLWSMAGLKPSAPKAGGRLKASTQSTNLREMVLARSGQERVVDPFMSRLANRARKMSPAGFTESLERRVNVAGIGRTWPIERVLAGKVILAAALGGVAFLLFILNPGLNMVVLLVALVLAGWFLPDLLLYGRAKERMEDLENELPDVLDQMTVSVEAGLGFEAAMARIAQEGGTHVAEEFGRAIQDIQIGVPRQQAMERILERTDAPDLRHFIASLGQAERLGVPLAKVLRVQAEELREKRRIRAQERATKVPVKLVIPLVLCILPALFVVILGPSVIRVMDSGLFS